MSKSERLSSPDRLEQELSELQARLNRGLTALGELESIQQHVAGLVETYNTVKGLLDSAEQTLGSQQGQFDAIRTSLETVGQEQASAHEQHIREQTEASQALAQKNEEEWQSYRAILNRAQEDLNTANSNLQTEVGLKIEELRGSVESRVQGFHELQGQFESTLQRELESMHGKLDELGFDADSVRGEVALLQSFNKEMATNVNQAVKGVSRSTEAATGLARAARALAVVAVVAGAIGLLLHFVPIDLTTLLAP